MHIASQNGHLDVIRLLLDSGIPVDIRNGDPSTPLALASSEGKVEVGHFLIEREADVNARDKDGWTPLHFASRYGHLDAVTTCAGSWRRCQWRSQWTHRDCETIAGMWGGRACDE
jgi:ankyrin repeat protein